MNSNKFEIGDLVVLKEGYYVMQTRGSVAVFGIVSNIQENFYRHRTQDRVTVDWFNKDWGISYEPANALHKIS